MRLGGALLVLLGLAAGAACVRLGIWQLARAAEKRELHARSEALLALPPIEVDSALPAAPPETGRRVHVRGAWDRDRHVLLSGRTHIGAAGVSLATVARLPSGERLLVERGWLEAADSRTAHPELLPDSMADVMGVALPLGSPARASAWESLPSERTGVELWSARTLDSAQVFSRVPGPLAAWMVRALPSSPAAPRTSRDAAPIPEPYELPGESVHMAYAIQWFAIAVLLAGGSIALALRRRPAATT